MMAMVMVSNYFDGHSNLMLDVDVVSKNPTDIDVEFQPNVESHSLNWHLAYYFWTKLKNFKKKNQITILSTNNVLADLAINNHYMNLKNNRKNLRIEISRINEKVYESLHFQSPKYFILCLLVIIFLLHF